MKIEKVVPKLPDVQLTLTAAEAKALFNIMEDFDTDAPDESPYMVDEERFDVTLHMEMLSAGINGKQIGDE